MGVGACCQRTGSVPDQTVNAYLVNACTVQQGSECVAAVVRRVISCDSDGLQGGFELPGVCSCCGWFSTDEKEEPVID